MVKLYFVVVFSILFLAACKKNPVSGNSQNPNPNIWYPTTSTVWEFIKPDQFNNIISYSVTPQNRGVNVTLTDTTSPSPIGDRVIGFGLKNTSDFITLSDTVILDFKLNDTISIKSVTPSYSIDSGKSYIPLLPILPYTFYVKKPFLLSFSYLEQTLDTTVSVTFYDMSVRKK